MLKLARRVGQVFGLDLYGVDVLETPQGLMLVDINDFPSFYGVHARSPASLNISCTPPIAIACTSDLAQAMAFLLAKRSLVIARASSRQRW